MVNAKKAKKTKDDDIDSLRQVPLHLRERLARATTKTQSDDDVKFIKQVPLHSRERLIKEIKKLKHPRGRMENKELQIAMDNISALMEGKFSFDPKKILNKTILFDTSRVDEELIMDRIIESLCSDNDELYIINEPETNSFSVRRKMENKEKVLQKAKNMFENLKTDYKVSCFLKKK